MYSSTDFVYFRENSTVYITLKFQLSPFSTDLNLYRVFTFPLSIPGQQHSTIISNLPKFIAWNEVDSSYIDFQDQPYLGKDKIYQLDSGLEI